MTTTYKNTTDCIMRVEDINVRFSPKGKIGDKIDLSTLVSASQIERSQDLQTLIRKGILAPVSHAPVQIPQKIVAKTPTFHPPPQAKKLPTNEEESFVVYDRKLKAGRDNPEITGAVIVSLKKAKENQRQATQTPPLSAAPPETLPPEIVQASLEVVSPEAAPEAAPEATPPPEMAAPEDNLVMELEASGETPEFTTVVEDTTVEELSKEVPQLEEANPKLCSKVKPDGSQCKRRRQTESEFCYSHNQEL